MSVAAIGIVCKAPLPGRSKTRLATVIGDVAASELSARAAAYSYGQPAARHAAAASRQRPAACNANGSPDSSGTIGRPNRVIQYASSARIGGTPSRQASA